LCYGCPKTGEHLMHFANIITLTTDFGLQDPYVGQVKGAILKNNISVRVIDICHSIPAHEILTAAITIRTSYDYFPRGSIHLVIVDPGVGSQRRILAAAAEHHQELKRAMQQVVFKKSLEGESLSLDTRLSDLIQCADDDLYIYYGISMLTQKASSP